MQKLLLVLLLAIIVLQLGSAQECQPDRTLPDTAIGPFPRPYDPVNNPRGGITDTACVNGDFRFAVTLVVPRTFSIAGLDLPIVNIRLNPETAISNLPKGLDYACNPPNCVFPADTSGCIVIYGRVTDTVGVYDIKISGQLVTTFTNVDLQFPDATLFRGNYYLHVKPAGQCVTSTDDLANLEVSALNRPNPFYGFTQIVIHSKVTGNFDFVVSDLVGRPVHRERVSLWEGENILEYDGSQLATGVYLYTIGDGERQFTGKMLVNR